MGSKYRDYAVYTVRETSFMFVSLQDHVTEPSGSFNIAKPRLKTIRVSYPSLLGSIV